MQYWFLRRSIRIFCLLIAGTAAGLPCDVATAGDWPQVLGPQRNGQAADETLLAAWPASGPVEVWRQQVGSGFAGPAVLGQEVYIFHRVGSAERLQRLDATTGRETWRADFEASYRGGINPDTGPRCVPLVHGPNVYVFGAAGDLHCVARRNGAKIWSRSTHTELQADEGYFGAGSTPIAMGNVLLVNVGGRPNAGIVAFSLKTGETVWKKTDERASYSAPTQAMIDGHSFAIFATRYNALAIAPATGDIRFRFPFGQRGPTVNAATPIIFDNQLFLSAAYGVGCVLTQIDKPELNTVWANDQTLSSQYNTAIHYQNHLYGIHGREDVGQAELRCVEAKSGNIKWTESDFGVAHLILADNKILLLKIDGTLLLAQPNPARFTQLNEAQVSRNTTRALPALAHGHYMFRDNQQDKGSLVCLKVGP